jgi:hypothetical protein
MVAYSPAVLNENAHDGRLYIKAAHHGLLTGDREPLGYPLFLRALHAISHQLAFTISVQHALGLLTGVLLFMTARQLGVSPWLALVPAAVVWLGGDELFVEHAPLSESLFTPLLAATLYAGVRCLNDGSRWPVTAGALAAMLLAVRSVGLPLPLLMLAWVAVASWRIRLPMRRLLPLMVGGTLVVTLAYCALHDKATGSWSPVAAGSGWGLYSRAAEFADCRDFTPPRGTAMLCDPTPPSKRRGPDYYLYVGGPAHAAFGKPASHDPQVRAFALAAIIHQPLDFLGLVGTDVVRYVDPGFGRLREYDFIGPGGVAFPSGRPRLDPPTADAARAYYGPVSIPAKGAAEGLRHYQRVVRISGVLLAVLFATGLFGIGVTSGRHRWGMILALALALELLLYPAIKHASWRYALPAEGPIAVAAVVAAPALARRLAAALDLLRRGRVVGEGS